MSKYDSYILSCFTDKDYILGKELNDLLRKKFKLESEGYERKILQRAVQNGIIGSSEPLTFGNGQFVYLKKGYSLNKESVLDITRVNRPGLYRILKMLDLNGGIISEYEALKLATVPLDSEKTKNDSIEKILSELESLGFIKAVSTSAGVKFIIYPVHQNDLSTYAAIHTQRMVVDSVFLPDVLRSLQKLNLLDNTKYIYRSRLTPHIGVSHNNFVWDAVAYTKTTGISPFSNLQDQSKEKQTMVVFDIVVNRPYTDFDLQGFFGRIQSTINSVKGAKRKLLPVVIYAELESKILKNRIRKLGFMSYELGAIFGNRIHEIIANISEIRNFESDDKTTIVDIVADSLEKIHASGQEDNLSLIKGDLFEFMMLHVLKVVNPAAHIDHAKILKEYATKELYEYDFIIINHQTKDITIVEVKGYSKSNYISLGDSETKNSLNWFFRKTFPFAQNQLKKSYPDFNYRACYITTSSFKEDGVKFLEQISNGKLKPQAMELWYDGNKLLNLLDANKIGKVKDLIKRYFINQKDKYQDYEEEN